MRAKSVRRPKGPREIACEILDRLRDPRKRASQELLERGAALEDERDRGLAKELVTGTLRNLAFLDATLEELSGIPPDRIDAALLSPLRVGLHQILHLDRVPPPAAVNESVKLARSRTGSRGAGFVNAILRKAASSRDRLRARPSEGHDAASLALHYSIPPWLVARWVDRWGADEAREFLEATARPAPVSLRVNRQLCTSEELARDLLEEGIVTEASERIPDCLRIRRGNPARSRAFRQGMGYLQDEGSQAIAWLMPLRPGQRVLDACAAPGGKSFILASRAGSRGWVVAVDCALPRLRRLIQNRARLKIPNVVPMVADLEAGSPFSTPFDAVLLDAPCTGTGVLGRHPEIRWRREPGDLVALAARQKRLLHHASLAVSRGGHLLYSVCSLEPEEGEDPIRRFLETHADFEQVPLLPLAPPGLTDAVTREGFLRLTPHRHGTDGFFAALLKRHGTAAGSVESTLPVC